MPIHIVLGVAALSALAVVICLVVRTLPAGAGSGEVVPADAQMASGEHNASPRASAADGGGAPAEPDVIRYQYKVVNTYPHDPRAFTQGLVYEDGFVYEGTGLHGRSAIVRRELATGKAVKMLRLPDKYFGEGITLFGDKLIQLTWQSHVGFVYTKDTFTPLREFAYPTEGWGITHDGTQLIYSDGTATLHRLDPNTYAETGRIEVRDRGRPVRGLNELEFIDGSIFANIWPTDDIAVIDPKTGRITGRLNLSTLYPQRRGSEDVLNGIAWIPETRRLLVTGKLWPRLYELELIPEPPRRTEQRSAEQVREQP